MVQRFDFGYPARVAQRDLLLARTRALSARE